MSTMWMSLLSLIALVITVVWLSNWLQDRQIRVREAWRETLSRAPKMTRQVLRASYRRRLQRVWESSRVEPTFTAFNPPGANNQLVAEWPDTLVRAPRGTVATESLFGGGLDAPDAPIVNRTPTDLAGRAERPDWADSEDALALEPMAVAQALGDEPVPPPLPSVHARLDPRLDCIVEFALPGVIAKDKVLSALSSVRRVGAKPVLVEVDTGDGRWVLPDAQRAAVHRVRAGVLLANRSGALHAMEFAEFGDALHELAHALGAPTPELPEMSGVLQHAAALDGACVQFDVMIGLTVELPAELNAEEWFSLAVGLGLTDRGAGRFAALGAGVEPLFNGALSESGDQVVFVLEVARAMPSAQPWPRMVACARACAQRVNGRLIDDAGQVLSDLAVEHVARQLCRVYASLEEAGLDAGSPAALRVFN